MKVYFLLPLLAGVLLNTSVQADDAAAHDHNSASSATASAVVSDHITEAAKGAKVFFVQPIDGAVVSRTFTVRFGAAGIDIVPAGVMQENSGHHHILIDQEELPALDKPVPATDEIIHFGKGQTETELTLSPGKHTLQLLLGNFAHIPHKTPVVSEKITITVE